MFPINTHSYKFANIIVLLLMLAGCGGGGGGGGGSSNSGGIPSGSTATEVAVVTPAGVLTGTAVTKSIDSGGGTVYEPTTGGNVKVAMGAYNGAADVTVQATTDTLPFGIGDGITISATQRPSTPLIVTMSYGSDVTHPSQLGLAMQVTDGSWQVLEPVRIDTTAKTISAAIPTDIPTSVAVQIGAPRIPAAIDTPAYPGRTVVRYINFFMKPDPTSVHVSKQETFTPYVRESILEYPPTPPCDSTAGDECLLDPPPRRPVIQDVVFTNDKPGYTRKWFVNNIEGGSATLGTIEPNSPSGATFTAPATKPSPNTVEVKFTSEKNGGGGIVVITADVTITDSYHITGTMTSIGLPICFDRIADVGDGFEVDVVPDPANQGFYLVQNPSNESSAISAPRPDPNYSGTTSGDLAFEMFTATGGNVIAGTGTGSEQLHVIINGTSTSSSCTGTPPFGSAITVPSITGPTVVEADFSTDAFVDGVQVLAPFKIENSTAVWDLTATEN